MGGRGGDWVPEIARDAPAVVLLVLDGLGWNALQEHKDRLPTIAGMTGRGDHDGRPVDDRDRTDLDLHGAHARPARRARVPDGRLAARC